VRGGSVLVAIPTLNEAARIEDVYHQLIVGLPDDRRVRFFVADGGSVDGTQEIVRRISASDPRVQLLANPGRIQSAAVNLVASQAMPGDAFLIRADAHTNYPAGFIDKIIEALARTGADSVVVPMDSAGATPVARAIARISDTPVGSGGSAHRGGQHSGFVDHGHHAGWRLASFRRARGYDETYTHNEDAELDCRITRMGGRIWLESRVRLTYFVRSTFSALALQYRNYGKGRARTARRHPGSIRFRQILVIAGTLANILSCALASVLPWILCIPFTYVVILAIVSMRLAIRYHDISAFWGGVAAAVMHFSWTFGFLEGLVMNRAKPWSWADVGAGHPQIETSIEPDDAVLVKTSSSDLAAPHWL